MSTDTNTQNLIQRKTAIEKEVTTAETEVTIRKRQLRELTPQRKKLEQECLDTFQCSIDDLPQALESLEKQMVTALTKLEKKVEELKSEKTVQES